MTICLHAVSVGCAVPRPDFKLSVHSLFCNSANLGGGGDSLLLTLLFAGGADLPQGIRLGDEIAFKPDEMHIGMPAVCKDDMLLIGNAVSIDLHTAQRWECDLHVLDADFEDSAVVAAWQQAWRTLREWQQLLSSTAEVGQGSLSKACIWDRHLESAGSRLLNATMARDLDGMQSAADLIGAGPGLTPAGDDLLTGYMAGLWCTSRREAVRQDFLWALAELVIRLAARTNDISRTYLCLAARGQVSSRLLELARCICYGGEASCVAAAADRALRVGHTSGMEGVKGLLLGLATWDAPQLIRQALGAVTA